MPNSTLFTVTEVQKIRVDRGRVNHETYKQLYNTVNDRIRRRASVNSTHLTYRIPPFVPGRPVYTPSHAARYITDKLRRGGFGVMAVDDGLTLFIDWSPRPRTLLAAAAPDKPPAAAPAPPPRRLTKQSIAASLDALKRVLV